MKQKGSGGKLKRSEVVTVRLDPRLRYGVELAARKHRRTASSFIEWAIEQSLKEVVIRVDEDEPWPRTAEDALDQVWDVDEPDRFIKLAVRFSELLSHEEQALWKLVRECDGLWPTSANAVDKANGININLITLREYWDDLLSVSKGEMKRTELSDEVTGAPGWGC